MKLPFFLLLLIIVRKWEVFLDTVTLNWGGGLGIEWRQEPLGASGNYAVAYMAVMSIFVVFPYMQEWWRCYRYALYRFRLIAHTRHAPYCRFLFGQYRYWYLSL